MSVNYTRLPVFGPVYHSQGLNERDRRKHVRYLKNQLPQIFPCFQMMQSRQLVDYRRES